MGEGVAVRIEMLSHWSNGGDQCESRAYESVVHSFLVHPTAIYNLL
ncbi:hypothetical protein [Haladaptatus caseinilyticus]|nr:hypothetical protein [Haladaptatus caseinilyticus]